MMKKIKETLKKLTIFPLLQMSGWHTIEAIWVSLTTFAMQEESGFDEAQSITYQSYDDEAVLDDDDDVDINDVMILEQNETNDLTPHQRCAAVARVEEILLQP